MTVNEIAGPNLFAVMGIELERYLARTRDQARSGVLVFPANLTSQVSQALFASLRVGGVCTQVVSSRAPWDPRSAYFESARTSARRGAKLTRVFLLPHRHYVFDERLREHALLDEQAGIVVEVRYVGDLLSSHRLDSVHGLDLGVWDRELLCAAVRGSGDSSTVMLEWRASMRPEDIAYAEEIIELIRREAPLVGFGDVPHGEASQLDLDEPMIASAPIADFVSSVFCRGDHVSREDCSWYHSVWQYLRILNLVSTPTWHASFFDEVLTGLARGGATRVLVSGAADYSMLAYVVAAWRRATARLEVTVLDMCETPLMLNRWYGKWVGEPIEVVQQDIERFEPKDRFDVIVTDAFLTRFSPSQRAGVVRKWSDLLAGGGRIVTTVRIERGLAADFVVATAKEADDFRRRVLREARRWQDFLPIAPDELARKAYTYAERMTSYSIRSEAELRDLFSNAGLRLTDVRTRDVPGEMKATTYLELVSKHAAD